MEVRHSSQESQHPMLVNAERVATGSWAGNSGSCGGSDGEAEAALLQPTVRVLTFWMLDIRSEHASKEGLTRDDPLLDRQLGAAGMNLLSHACRIP